MAKDFLSDVDFKDNLVTLTSTDAGSSAAPILELYRNSSSPADGDYIGQIKFQGRHDGGAKALYAKITGKIGDASDGSEDGIIEIAHQKAGSNNISARFTSTALKLINGTGLEIADGLLTLGSTAVTSTGAELNILDGVTSTTAELNILDGVTSTTAELNILDGVTSTTAELNILDGVTSTAAELNLVDGITAGTVSASLAVIADSNKDVTGFRNVTATGIVDAVNYKVNGGQGSDGQVLTSTGSGVAWEDAGGGGGSPAGSDTQIQFNNSGSFGADSQMSFTAATGLDVSPSTYSGNFLGCALRIKGEGGTTWQSGSIFYVDKDDVRMARVGFDNGTTTWTWKMSYHSSMSAWLSLGSQSGTYFAIGGQGGVVSYANRTSFHPGTDNLTDIGTSSYRWVDIYATNGTIQTSDVALKKDITNTSLGLDFINSLRPVEYKWKDGGVRSHQGFIAQEVETALDASASSASDQAMWSQHGVNGASKGIEHYWEDYEEGEVMEREIDLPDYQSLRYNELIAPLVKAVQELTTRVAALEG